MLCLGGEMRLINECINFTDNEILNGLTLVLLTLKGFK